MNSLSLYADMIRFIRRPRFIDRRVALTPNEAVAILGLICLIFLTLIPISFIQALFFGLTGLQPPKPSDAFEALNNSPRFVLIAIVFAPLIEEVLFRSWLGFRRGVLVILPALLLLLTGLGLMSETNPSALTQLIVLIAFAAAALYGWKWYVLKPGVAEQSRILRHVFPFIFWGTALLFGGMHGANFAPGFPIWAMPVVVLPLIFVGAVFGFIRMRFGFLIGILFHSGYNALVVTISSLLMFAAG
jgi:hypothetical protein